MLRFLTVRAATHRYAGRPRELFFPSRSLRRQNRMSRACRMSWLRSSSRLHSCCNMLVRRKLSSVSRYNDEIRHQTRRNPFKLEKQFASNLPRLSSSWSRNPHLSCNLIWQRLYLSA